MKENNMPFAIAFVALLVYSLVTSYINSNISDSKAKELIYITCLEKSTETSYTKKEATKEIIDTCSKSIYEIFK